MPRRFTPARFTGRPSGHPIFRSRPVQAMSGTGQMGSGNQNGLILDYDAMMAARDALAATEARPDYDAMMAAMGTALLSAGMAGTIPTTPEGCVQQVKATYQAVPGVWEALVAKAGSEEQLLAAIQQSCQGLVAECGGLEEQACQAKLCPSMTKAECDEELKRRFGSGGGKKEEEKSSFPWWAVGLGAVALAGAGAYWYSQQPKANPVRVMKSSMMERWLDNEVKVDTWEERDRLGISIEDVASGKTLAEWWDDEARELFEDGFFSAKNLDRSVIEYADHVGIRPYAGSGKRRRPKQKPKANLMYG